MTYILYLNIYWKKIKNALYKAKNVIITIGLVIYNIFTNPNYKNDFVIHLNPINPIIIKTLFIMDKEDTVQKTVQETEQEIVQETCTETLQETCTETLQETLQETVQEIKQEIKQEIEQRPEENIVIYSPEEMLMLETYDII